jgi:hypothetical protein
VLWSLPFQISHVPVEQIAECVLRQLLAEQLRDQRSKSDSTSRGEGFGLLLGAECLVDRVLALAPNLDAPRLRAVPGQLADTGHVRPVAALRSSAQHSTEAHTAHKLRTRGGNQAGNHGKACFCMVPGAGLEPAYRSLRDFKSLASTNFATRARCLAWNVGWVRAIAAIANRCCDKSASRRANRRWRDSAGVDDGG